MRKHILRLCLLAGLIALLCASVSAFDPAIAGQPNRVSRVSDRNYAVVDADGVLWAWGMNGYGQLGVGNTGDSGAAPVRVMDAVWSVSTSDSNGAAIRTDGSLWMWGSNAVGELGLPGVHDRNVGLMGDFPIQTRPVKVMDGVQAVSLGGQFALAIKNDGSLWAWGDNSFGQLGDGTATHRDRPVKILDGVVACTAGDDFSAAVKSDGTLWTWGYNGFGQLGDGTTTTRYTPKQVMTDVKMVSACFSGCAAVRTDGTLWIWGLNKHGQIGNGTVTESHTPKKVLDSVRFVSLGSGHTAAIRTDGSLWLWGDNEYGALGTGGSGNYHHTAGYKPAGYHYDQTRPAQLMEDVYAVSAGGLGTAVIRADGSLYTWGYRDVGEKRLSPEKSSLKVGIPAPVAGFYDVRPGDWFAEDVKYAYDNGLMNGTGPFTFLPNAATTRAQVVTILYRMAGSPQVAGVPFDDTPAGAWYTPAVAWAYHVGIVNGVGEGRFAPTRPVTREQLAVMLRNYAEYRKYPTPDRADLGKFPDAGSVSPWARDALSWANAAGLVNGVRAGGADYLRPQGNATRAQVAAILHRFCETVR